MLLACLALGLISCRDTIDPREARAPSEAQLQQASGPVTVLKLTCTLSFTDGQEKGEVSCSEPGAGKKGVSQNVILPWYSAYAVWLPFNLVKDTTTETWTFIASVKNLLGQPIGTLDGTTAVGSKVFITYGPVASQGSGDVWITNADGTGNFTAADQKYFNYPWIIAPQATSPYREWKTHVPKTVTEVTMGVAISTDFPAEQNVASMPPDGVPDWIYADSNIAAATPEYASRFVKNVALVMFEPSATIADRQLAVAKVGGEVIGGVRITSSYGAYVLHLDVASTADLFSKLDTLRAMPQVRTATPESIFDRGLDYLKARDDSSVSKWSLYPDRIGQEPNWALERIAAPMAWGCSVGSSATTIGVVDAQFHANVPDLSPSYISNSTTTAGRHGLAVASIIGADGNDGDRMSGVMWRSDLRLYARDFGINGTQPMTTTTDMKRIAQAALDGARVINLSGGAPPDTGTEAAMKARVFAVAGPLAVTMRELAKEGHVPLLVLSSGNYAVEFPKFNSDAFYNAYPVLADSLPDQVLVVGATSRFSSAAPTASYQTESLRGNLVQIVAPGEDVLALNEQGEITHPFQGTSAAAPLVTGAAGLLFDFDPALTAAQVKQLLVDGATKGGRGVQDSIAGHQTPLLNIYESLKLAAERPGAPLCGNHVWVAGHTVGSTDFDTVVVQRGVSATEKIWGNDPEGTIAILDVQHGGHRISYNGATEYRAIGYNPLTRQWQSALPDDSLPLVSDGGTYNSYRWTSHDGDSSLSFSTAIQRTPTVTIKLYDSYAGTTNVLATVPTLLTKSIFTDSACVRLYREENKCQNYDPVGDKQEANVLAAYSPVGDSAIISVARTQISSIGISAWALCDTAVIHHPDSTTSVNHYDCRGVEYWKNSVDTKFYKIPTNTVTSNPSASWTMNGVRATQLAITEDGSELAVGYGTIDQH